MGERDVALDMEMTVAIDDINLEMEMDMEVDMNTSMEMKTDMMK